MSIGIDAPRVDEPVRAIARSVAVEPSTNYAISASFSASTTLPAEVPISLQVGRTTVDVPELNAHWLTVEESYRTGPDETSVEIAVIVTGPARAVAVDDVQLKVGGVNVVPNGSFEQATSEPGIRNHSLIMQQQTAALAVNLGGGEATWTALDPAGLVSASGANTITDGLSAVPLDGIPAGYHEVTVTAADGTSIMAPVVVLDMPTPFVAVDGRLGTHVHAQKDFAAASTPAAGSVGLGIIRLGDNWQTTEPRAGEYEFSGPFERASGEALALGMETLFVVGRTNKAYDGGRTPWSEQALEAYSRYAAALTTHFNPTAVEVYNEFNIPSFNKGPCGLTADCYLPVLEAGYEGVKSVDPLTPVIGGVTANFDPDWLYRLWQLGGLSYTDAISYHPYNVYHRPESIATTVNQADAGMSAFGEARPVWITEMGWTTARGGVGVSERDQAVNLVRGEIAALGGGADRFFWYDLVNDKEDAGDHEGNFGLFRQYKEGVAAYPPKPAAYAQALVANAIAGKELVSTGLSTSAMSVYEFGSGSAGVKIAWGSGSIRLADDARSAAYSVDGGNAQLYAGGSTVEVGTVPIVIVPVP